MNSDSTATQHRTAIAWTVAEVLLIVAMFFVQAGSAPPDVNEAHYLVKARHFWVPSFCAGDLFCESSDAHWTFYFTLGWLTKFMSLPAAAWVGRMICWTLLAYGWQRLCTAIAPGRWLAWISAGIAIVLWQHGHLGGEWVVGGVEAKSLAYGFVFLSLAACVRGEWNRSLLWAGGAAALHVLVGGWTIVALGIAWILAGKTRPAIAHIVPAVVAAIIIASPGWLPAILLSRGVDGATLAEANKVYVYERLSHHLIFHRFDHWFMLRHAALAGLIGWLWWKSQTDSPLQRLLSVCLGAAIIAALGAIIDQSLLYFPEIAAGLLRYYFFRLSDALLPVGVAIAFAAWLQQAQSDAGAHRTSATITGAAALLLIVVHLGFVTRQRQLDPLPPAVLQTMPRDGSKAVRLWGPNAFWQSDDIPPEELEEDSSKVQPGASSPPAEVPRPVGAAQYFQTAEQRAEWFRQWKQVCSWIRENTAPTDRFLTPRGQQTFKWYAQRPEVVNWKDVPQDARSLVQWHAIWQEVHPWKNGLAGMAGHSDQELQALGEKFDAQYVVIDRTKAQRSLHLPRVFPLVREPGTLLEVYWLPPPPTGK